MFEDILSRIIKLFLAVEENADKNLGEPKTILVVRQHNQLGDLIAASTLFRALKTKYPESKLTVIVSPDNHSAVINNSFINEIFVFDKKKIYDPLYFQKLLKILTVKYDLAIVPVTVSISFTSNLLARLSKSSIRIGVRKLNGMYNKYHYFFDRKVDMDWQQHPDCNVSDFCLDIVRPFGINTDNMKSEIKFSDEDLNTAENFLKEKKLDNDKLLIGMHIGAGKPPNRWSVDNFAELVKRLNEEYEVNVYLTGTNNDLDVINFYKKISSVKSTLFINKRIAEVAALISLSDLFITNDTGIMHVAGSTETPQISIFGPTNPFNWAPIGYNKYFLNKSDLINDVTVDDVYKLCKQILEQNKKVNEYRISGSN